MIITTTPSIEGHPITTYLGIVAGEAIVGANIFRDLFGRVHDIVCARAGAYENTLAAARQTALEEMTDAAKKLGAAAPRRFRRSSPGMS